jgi:GNAT superfamily N-acetyltransferase
VTEVVVSWSVEDDQLSDLLALFESAWWTAGRTAEETTRMLQESDVVVVLTDRASQRLVGFARVLTDYTYLAMVLDVIVDTGRRGSGYGATLMDAVVGHPALAEVRSIELICQPELIPFYRRWGFTDEVGRSLLMRRSSDSRLTVKRS